MHISTKCSIAVHCLVFINEYGGGRRVTSELLSLSTGCNPVVVRGIMSALKKAGIISVKSGRGGAEIGCSLDQISLYRVCMAVEPGAHRRPSARLEEISTEFWTRLTRRSGEIWQQACNPQP